MDNMNSQDVVNMLASIAKGMKENRDYLISLDSEIGDGDLGITMNKGFASAYDYAKLNSNLLPGMLFIKAGMEIIKDAPSTMGTLMGSGLIRGGKNIKEKNNLSAGDIVLFFEGFLQGVIDRGHAIQGEKTIVDVLFPAVEEMKLCKSDDISDIFKAGLIGAQKGIENEKTMMSQHGKAAVFREKTIPMKDPGSEAVLILFKSCTQF